MLWEISTESRGQIHVFGVHIAAVKTLISHTTWAEMSCGLNASCLGTVHSSIQLRGHSGPHRVGCHWRWQRALLITVTLWEHVVNEELKSTSGLWDMLPIASATKERHNMPASSSQWFPISSVFIWFTASHKTKHYAILGKVVCWCVAKGREIWVFYACCSYLWNPCHLARSH